MQWSFYCETRPDSREYKTKTELLTNFGAQDAMTTVIPSPGLNYDSMVETCLLIGGCKDSKN
uniref:Uncharacterized protein n=1 Tax=Romanomermis culicivorax TaxID=13658 RepID=A0A915JKQ1_ROMCU